MNAPAVVLSADPVWDRVREEASAVVRREPALAGMMHGSVIDQPSLEHAVSERIAARLANQHLDAVAIRHAFSDALATNPQISTAIRRDLVAVLERDPACERLIEPLMYFKGFHAIQAQRVSHSLWAKGRRDFALMLQSLASAALQVDIHPAVPLGMGMFMDHASGVVIGATSTVGDNVSILQGVTLGGTGKVFDDRHPKIGHGVLIGAGAKILGNFEIGHCSRVAAGSVVLSEVPPNATVAGVPARIVGEAGCPEPSRTMDQIIADLGPAK
ncbi:MAG: serine O-acetyltransferase [Pseudomonadota bacterium]